MKQYCCELRQHIKDNYIPIAHNNVGTVEFHIVIDRAGDILLLNQILQVHLILQENYLKWVQILLLNL